MTGAPLPSGFDVAKPVTCPGSDCQITVGFDVDRRHIPRFVVRLHYTTSYFPLNWTTIGRFDHNEAPMKGHNIYNQGLHIDVKPNGGNMVKVYPRHGPIPQSRGRVIRACSDYFQANYQYFIDVYDGTHPPARPPQWPP